MTVNVKCKRWQQTIKHVAERWAGFSQDDVVVFVATFAPKRFYWHDAILLRGKYMPIILERPSKDMAVIANE
jgi:hypothetical protein